MSLLKSAVVATALVVLPTAVLAQGAPAANTNPEAVRSGDYKLEPSHGRILWQVTHMGFSVWYGDFARPTGTAHFDMKHPAADSVDITIPADSVTTTNATLDKELKSPDWFGVAQFPTIRFKSTKVIKTGPGAAKVVGDLTFHGVTKPVTLKVRFRGSGINTLDKHYTVGFDAVATIKRHDFGVSKLTHVGDDVLINISAPFEKP